jgi:hypothetical protein
MDRTGISPESSVAEAQEFLLDRDAKPLTETSALMPLTAILDFRSEELPINGIPVLDGYQCTQCV